MIMALEITIFAMILVAGVFCFVLSHFLKQNYIYLLGTLLVFLSGISLFIFDGLTYLHYYAVDGTLASLSLTTSNILLWAFAILLVVISFIAFIVFAGQDSVQQKSVFHF
jgi:hypothetical protein